MTEYKLSDFDFNLPDELIATHPAEPRDHSRLLLLDKNTGQIEHKHFYDIVDYFCDGDVLVLNNSKVIPARLMARKADTGGQVEVLLHKKLSDNVWQCLLGGKVREGLILLFSSNTVVIPTSSQQEEIAFVSQKDNSVVEKRSLGFASAALGMTAVILKNNHDGTWDLQFSKSGKELMKAIEEIGEMPLPPYIVKQREKGPLDSASAALEMTSNDNGDKADYQTIYANPEKKGSVAAPTAGLHFTPELLQKIKDKGVKVLEITLYVGMGTFAPVKTENIGEHKMHAEWVEIDSNTINLISNIKYKISKQEKSRIIAVGTTSARSLEACFSNLPAEGEDFKAWVDIFITPGYEFKVVDALVTNFHLPKSTLLMLVSALAGKKNIDKAYQEAIEEKYRFYSYGDAMFIK